ncbi:MAG: MFS transporter, partial [Bosea sp. (in: a-proteobacteria)]|nr:MFS transporter [Bosea sp. (in: a-proteobacteria)]
MTATTADSRLDKSAMVTAADRRRALIGSAVGSTVEWYDFFLYGTMTALVFNKMFFVSESPLVADLLSWSTFALAFLVRPIGGVIFAHIGDRIGRKKTLFMTLSLMGFSTVAMGLLPTYQQVGLLAPILLTLLRLVQGLALGGEWGGGLLLAVEYSPREKRGLYGSVPQIGALLGLALGNIGTSVLAASISQEDFLSWGWRLPFWGSIVLVLIGLWIRTRIGETPSFVAAQKAAAKAPRQKIPLVETLTEHWRAVLIVIGAKFVETATFFLFATFSLSYMVKTVGFPQTEALNIVLISAVVCIPAMLFYGSLSDRIGRKKLFVIGAIVSILYYYPFLRLLDQKSFAVAVGASVVGFAVIWATYGSVLGTFFAESFPAEVRYTGVSLGYQVGAAVAGGPMPLIATALVAKDQSVAPVAIFLAACAVVSLIAMYFTKDRTGAELD